MYKKVSPLPEELTLVLKYKDKNIEIIFDEPTIYTIYEVDRLFKKKQYTSILKKLNINIKEKVFIENPVWILKAIITLINWWDKEKNQSEELEENKFFLYSVFDRLWTKYWIDPLEIMKKYTPSQIKSLAEGIDFNKNVDDDKEYKNDIYLDPEYIEKRDREYETIMKRVYEAKEKLGLT